MVQAQEYVRKYCEALGMKVFTQAVKTPGATCKNLMAVLPGRTDARIVVGAHLDHIGKNRRGDIYNGADDNASGCAEVLVLAGMLAKTKPGCTIEFH
jgi:Zn-dependent M28 family amino/carboxypeptidase